MAEEEEQPEAQFPAPYRDDGEPLEEVEWLDPPQAKNRAVIAKHVREHGLKRFRLASHVYLGGPRRRSQHITWHPVTATFTCDRCPGWVYGTQEEPTQAELELSQLFDDDLRRLLVGLRTDEERAEMARLYLTGELNRQQLEQAGQAAYRASSAHSRPNVAGRRERLQEWMLDRYTTLGVVTDVIDATEQLQRSDPELWAQLVGRPLVGSTIRRTYWNPIPAGRKKKAKERKKKAKERFNRAAKRGKV